MSFPDPRRRARQFGPEDRGERPSLLRHDQPYSIRTVTSLPVAVEPDSLRSVLRAVLRSWWIILICAAVAAGAGVALAQTKPQQYQAQTYLLLNGNTYQSAIAGGYNPVDPTQQQAMIAGLLTPNLLASSAHKADLAPTANYSVTTAASGNSGVMRIVATTPSERTAPALSNAVAGNVVRFLQHNNGAQLQDAKRVLGRQIATARNAGDRHTLTAQLNNLSDLNALINKQVQVIETANYGAPISRRTVRIGAIGLVIGLLVGVSVSLMRRRDPGQPLA